MVIWVQGPRDRAGTAPGLGRGRGRFAWPSGCGWPAARAGVSQVVCPVSGIKEKAATTARKRDARIEAAGTIEEAASQEPYWH
ncbi:MAG: hypothetical protein K0Q93_2817 [Nocardioidaceae bacterium]|nr:hypothetical protein [Nocardioidaceae bacterium]